MSTSISISIPHLFGFQDHEIYSFENALNVFKWDIQDCDVTIDLTKSRKANYQAMSLVILYVWHLYSNNCRITIIPSKHNNLNRRPRSKTDSINFAAKMWYNMGAQGWFHVLNKEHQNFIGHSFKPLFAIRNNIDFKKAITGFEKYSSGFDIEYVKLLRYVLSELLYNTIEHGHTKRIIHEVIKQIPSVFQFTWYANTNQLHFIIADLGIGIKKHLEQSYPAFSNHSEAILHSLRYQISGTFNNIDPYASKDNAGVGLYLSSHLIQRLEAEMHIISGNGYVHISPRDRTSRNLSSEWPGTFVLVSIKLKRRPSFSLDRMMSELHEAARLEVQEGIDREKENQFYVNIKNFFGRYAEDKSAAIKFRDKYLLDEISKGKTIILDFNDVITAPHSFLSALIATPIQRFGIKAFLKIKIRNALPEIRETIDYIFGDNVKIE